MSNQHTGSTWKIYDNEINKILTENDGIEPIDVVKKFDLGLDAFGRQAFSKYIRRNRERILDKNEGIYEACKEIDVDFSSAKNLWIKTKNKSKKRKKILRLSYLGSNGLKHIYCVSM